MTWRPLALIRSATFSKVRHWGIVPGQEDEPPGALLRSPTYFHSQICPCVLSFASTSNSNTPTVPLSCARSGDADW